MEIGSNPKRQQVRRDQCFNFVFLGVVIIASDLVCGSAKWLLALTANLADYVTLMVSLSNVSF